ncbi:unnamed protein product [Xylocopa violacea]|uniref:Uncharacterized protein n=1 Tax=Xylocopa violacea TaxID=135666 RepID=A0ABP1N287_XYLVO
MLFLGLLLIIIKRWKEKPVKYDITCLQCLKCQEPDRVRENIELHLTETQVEEALVEDRQTALIQHFNLSTTALEALAQYGRSLRVSQLAAYRVLSISHLLVLPQPYSISSKPDSMHSTLHLKQLEVQKENMLVTLQDLLEHCSKHVKLPKYFSELLNNHSIKKKDFYTAAKNFKNFLSNFTLPVSQIEKLHKQYDAILKDYQQSRCMIDLELPKMINIRLTALREGFEKIKTFFNDAGDGNEIVMLFKSISEELCLSDSKSTTVSRIENSPKAELCQKCKVNHIDDK